MQPWMCTAWFTESPRPLTNPLQHIQAHTQCCGGNMPENQRHRSPSTCVPCRYMPQAANLQTSAHTRPCKEAPGCQAASGTYLSQLHLTINVPFAAASEMSKAASASSMDTNGLCWRHRGKLGWKSARCRSTCWASLGEFAATTLCSPGICRAQSDRSDSVLHLRQVL